MSRRSAKPPLRRRKPRRYHLRESLPPPVYWINLDRSIERKQRMLKQFKNFNVSNFRVSAVDGSIKDFLYDFNIQKSWKCGFTTNIEYAVTLSHLKAISEAYQDGHEVVMIMEDDISLLRMPNQYFLSICPDDWEIIQMSVTGSKVRQLYENPKEYFVRWKVSFANMGGYLINRKGMIRILMALAPNSLKPSEKSIKRVSFTETKMRWSPFPATKGCNADYIIYVLAQTYTCCDISMFEDRTLGTTVQPYSFYIKLQDRASNFIQDLFYKRGFLLSWV